MYEEDSESEFIKEILLDNEPTNEEIIYYLSQNGVNRYSGYATVEKIKALDFKNMDD